jgi:hypothetical protein
MALSSLDISGPSFTLPTGHRKIDAYLAATAPLIVGKGRHPAFKRDAKSRGEIPQVNLILLKNAYVSPATFEINAFDGRDCYIE